MPILGIKSPIGKVVNVAQSADFKVTGVLKDIPTNSSLQFAYHTQIPAVFFIGALITSLVIGLMTVIYKAIGAASANPVDALKHE